MTKIIIYIRNDKIFNQVHKKSNINLLLITADVGSYIIIIVNNYNTSKQYSCEYHVAAVHYCYKILNKSENTIICEAKIK